ncbi:trypsin-1 [Cherax quadricarinatus]
MTNTKSPLLLLILTLSLTCLGSSSGHVRQPRASVGIVGGEVATKGQFPYQVSFQERVLGVWIHFCGGSIIAPGYVITAAHCVEGADFTSPQGLRVVAGEQELHQVDGDEQVQHISFIIEHPFYDPITYENDIAILRLEEPLVYTQWVNQIELPQPDTNFTAEECRASGWGRTSEGGMNSGTLMYVKVPVLTDYHCRQDYTHDEIMDSVLCAGFEEGGKGTCNGDSGGPLACGASLAGIVSWSYGCAEPGLPGVYTEVSYFLEWIYAHVTEQLAK